MSTEQLEEIIENIRCATFHMNDEEAKPVIDGFLEKYPELLEYHNLGWYYTYC
jgi:hypothetical protein